MEYNFENKKTFRFEWGYTPKDENKGLMLEFVKVGHNPSARYYSAKGVERVVITEDGDNMFDIGLFYDDESHFRVDKDVKTALVEAIEEERWDTFDVPFSCEPNEMRIHVSCEG